MGTISSKSVGRQILLLPVSLIALSTSGIMSRLATREIISLKKNAFKKSTDSVCTEVQ